MKKYIRNMFKPIYVFAVGLLVSLLAFGSTFFLDQPQRYLNRDPAASATDMISTVSCIIHNTGAHREATPTNPNPPAYEALIDIESCRPNSAGSENTTPSYTRYWVQPEYTNGVLFVKAWAIDTPRLAYIYAQIQAGSSEQPPFGQWTVDWCTERLATESQSLISSDPCARKGHVTISADGTYSMYYREEISGSQLAFTKQTKGYVNSSQTSGAGKYFERFNDNSDNDRNGHFSFNNNALLDRLNGSEVCKDPRRDGNLKRAVWEAWLYDPQTQERVAYNGGFPVKQRNGSSIGWAGFEGVRLAGQSNPEIAGEFVRMDSVGGVYTAFGSYGKLIKNTNSILPNGLQDIDKLILRTRLRKSAFGSLTSVIDNSSGSAEEQFVLLYWDHTNSRFEIIARDKYSSGPAMGREFVDISPTIPMSPSQFLTYSQTDDRPWERRMWAFQMGSNNQFVIQMADNDVGQNRNGRFYPTVKNTNEIKVFRQIQTNVVPGSSDAPSEDLVCIGKCPRPNGNSTGAPLTLEADYEFAVNDPRVTQLYRYNNATGNLTINSFPVRFETQHINRNNIDTGRSDLWLGTFVTSNQLAGLQCRDGFCVWDTVGYDRKNSANTFGDLDLTSYYNWNTGPERWQRFSGVKDSQGRIVAIQEPLMLTYSAPNETQFGRYANKKVAVRYPGNGQLWLPGRCENTTNVNLQTSASCSQTNEVFIHDFIIPTELGARGRVRDSQNREYLVKWARQGVYYPQHTNPNACAVSDIQTDFVRAANFELPTESVWRNPRPLIGPATNNALANPSPRYINGMPVN